MYRSSVQEDSSSASRLLPLLDDQAPDGFAQVHGLLGEGTKLTVVVGSSEFTVDLATQLSMLTHEVRQIRQCVRFRGYGRSKLDVTAHSFLPS